MIYFAEAGDTRVREFFIGEMVTVEALKGEGGVDGVGETGNGILDRGTSLCEGTEARSRNR